MLRLHACWHGRGSTLSACRSYPRCPMARFTATDQTVTMKILGTRNNAGTVLSDVNILALLLSRLIRCISSKIELSLAAVKWLGKLFAAEWYYLLPNWLDVLFSMCILRSSIIYSLSESHRHDGYWVWIGTAMFISPSRRLIPLLQVKAWSHIC